MFTAYLNPNSQHYIHMFPMTTQEYKESIFYYQVLVYHLIQEDQEKYQIIMKRTTVKQEWNQVKYNIEFQCIIYTGTVSKCAQVKTICALTRCTFGTLNQRTGGSVIHPQGEIELIQSTQGIFLCSIEFSDALNSKIFFHIFQ